MTPFELLNARAALGAAIGMTLQEWRELSEAIAGLPPEEMQAYEEVDLYRSFNGKIILISTEPA